MSSSQSDAKSPPKSRGRNRQVRPSRESASRADSEEGGVLLPPPQNDAAPKAGNRRRRPRKLVSQTSYEEGLAQTAQGGAGISLEVEALKSKVKEIEAQVQEILLRPVAPGKSARRRTRNSRSQQQKEKEETQDEAVESSPGPSDVQEELERLQGELTEAQGELSTLRDRRQTSSTILDESDDVEDIPRFQGPGLEVHNRPRPLGRAVTLSGSYRIPIPVDVSDADMDAIGRGIKSAQNIARTFLDSERQRRRSEALAEPSSSGTWSEWFGGYSVSIAKAVSSMQLTSNIETTPQPRVIEDSTEPERPRRKPPKLELRSKKRPGMAEAGRTLSESQVAGLLA